MFIDWDCDSAVACVLYVGVLLFGRWGLGLRYE
jgi:hypothetical protein